MIDGGCTDHLIPFLDDFAHLSKEVCYASVTNGEKVPMYGPGKVIVQQWSHGQCFQPVTLEEVWYAPQAAHRLLSVPTLTTQGYRCSITHKESKIWNASRDLVIQATILSPSNNLHWFQSNQITPMGDIISSLAQNDSYYLWHHCFGHLSKNALCQAASKVSGISTVIMPPFLAPCKGCALGKMHDHPYAPSDKWATRPLALVHTDVVGPMPVEPCSQSQYILTFIDNFSGYALVAFICTKDAVLQHFHSMVSWAETFTGHSLTSVRSDQGRGFLGRDLQSFFLSRGITHQTSVPHTPQQNGHAERFNHTLLEKAEAMWQHACLPKSFWQDAVETSLHIYNRQPMHCHNWKMPIEIFNGDKPDISYFRVFGTCAYVFIP